jgi:hypothetical protein
MDETSDISLACKRMKMSSAASFRNFNFEINKKLANTAQPDV